jgi:hypothetical protein
MGRRTASVSLGNIEHCMMQYGIVGFIYKLTPVLFMQLLHSQYVAQCESQGHGVVSYRLLPSQELSTKLSS